MTILHIINNLNYGGAERLLLQMAFVQKQRGHVVKIICIAPAGDLERRAKELGIPVTTLGQPSGISIFAIFRLAGIMCREKAHIVHNHNARPQVYGSIAAKLAGIRSITTRHGNERKSIPRWLWSMSKKVVFISKATEKTFLDAKWVKPSQNMVIHNGIDLSVFSSLPKQRIAGHRLGLVARLAPEKDIGTLIEAFRIVQRTLPDAELVIVGDGVEKTKLEGLATGMRVRFLGNRDDIPELMHSFDVFVLASLSEGISLTLLEAMAASRPIVATNVGGNPEVVVHGETGFLVPPQNPQVMAEKILELLNNPVFAQKMGQAGLNRVRTVFNLEIMADKYEKIYKEILCR